MNLELQSLISGSPSFTFEQVKAYIDVHYHFKATAFNNGELRNAIGQNEGSCKIFAFAQLQQLTDAQTLACFGEIYKKVLENPIASDHGNVRQFMLTGHAGISFDEFPLLAK